VKGPPACPNREQIEYDDLLRKLMELLFVYRGMIWVTILKNIALVTYALIILFHGARGLIFYGDNPAPRLTRLLLAFSLSYLLCLSLGSTQEAEAVRAFVEIKRSKPRHGTTRTLSVLSIGILRLSLKKFSKPAYRDLLKIISRLSRGKGVIQWCLSPPQPIQLSFKQ